MANISRKNPPGTPPSGTAHTAWNAALQAGTRCPGGPRNNNTPPSSAAHPVWDRRPPGRHPLRQSAAEHHHPTLPHSKNASERRLPAGIDRREAVETAAFTHPHSKAGVDEETAYTAAREMEFVADRSVAARIETHMDVFGARMETANAQLLVQFQAALQGAVRDLRAEFKADLGELRAEVKADLAEVKADLAEVKGDLTEVKANLGTVTADVGALKREVRLIWGCLSLLVATLTAVLIRLFAA